MSKKRISGVAIAAFGAVISIAFQNCAASHFGHDGAASETSDDGVSTAPYQAADVQSISLDYERPAAPFGVGSIYGGAGTPASVVRLKSSIQLDALSGAIAAGSVYVDAQGAESANCSSYLGPLPSVPGVAKSAYESVRELLETTPLIPGKTYRSHSANGAFNATITFHLHDGTRRVFGFVATAAAELEDNPGGNWSNLEAFFVVTTMHRCP